MAAPTGRRPPTPVRIPRGLPTTWPAGEALDAMVEIDDVGVTDLWIPADRPYSQDDGVALAYLAQLQRRWEASEEPLGRATRLHASLRLQHGGTWRAELIFERGQDEWCADGEGSTAALAICHALVQCSDEPAKADWQVTSVRWYDPDHDEDDEDYDGEALDWVYEGDDH